MFCKNLVEYVLVLEMMGALCQKSPREYPMDRAHCKILYDYR
jgi:hypothetical protein